MPDKSNTVVLLGNISGELAPLDGAVQEFGWEIENAADLARLRELNAGRDVVAILFEPEALGMRWQEALRAVLDAAPKAHPILCQRFSESIPWPELAEAGAFHSLRLPVSASEIRQSLGFVWAAKNKRSGKGGRLHGPSPARRRANRIVPASATRALPL